MRNCIQTIVVLYESENPITNKNTKKFENNFDEMACFILSCMLNINQKTVNT